MNLSIRKKIGIVSLLLASTGFLSWLIAFQFIQMSKASLYEVKNNRLKILLLARDAESNFENYINNAVVAVSTKEIQVLEDEKARLTDIENTLSYLERTDASYKPYVQFSPFLKQIHEVSLEYIRDISGFSKTGKNVSDMLDTNNKKIQTIKRYLGELKKKAENDFNDAAEKLSHNSNQFIISSAISLGLLILFVIFSSLFILGSVLKRIGRLKNHFSVTNLDSLEPIPDTGDDELGDLLKASNTMLMDIKAARSQLVEKDFVENIVNTLNDILIVCDEKWKVIRMNLRSEKFFFKKMIYSKDIFEVIQENVARKGPSIEEMKSELLKTGTLNSEALITHDSKETNVHISAAAMTPSLKMRKTYVFIIRDKTGEIANEREKELLHAQLAQSSKLASLGTLGAGVAHELNNPLSAIMGYAELLKNNKEVPEKIRDFGNTILKCGRRMSGIIDEFRKFSRDNTRTDFEPFAMHDPIEGVLFFLQHRINYIGIEIQMDLVKEDDFVLGDHNQIESIFLNFLNNSCDSFGEVKDDRREFINIKSFIKNSVITIKVEDNAMGIPEDKIKHIFDPFFTTKPVGSGTGLGLFVVHQIIKNHNGTVQVKSTEGKGTIFTLTFPLTDERSVKIEDIKLEAV